MRICAMSDLHGELIGIEPCDLVLICGDSVSLREQSNYQKGFAWYRDRFKPWASTLPCEKVLFIFGNHELCAQGCEQRYLNLFPASEKVILLHDSQYEYVDKNGKVIKIYGTPWCKIFGKWAYMASNEKLAEIYSQIPNDLDILMTHDQPYGYGDIIQQEVRWNTGEHIGNKPLAKAVEDKQPSLLLTGHLHTTPHEEIKIGNTSRYNVSIKDEYYNPVFDPLYLNIN